MANAIVFVTDSLEGGGVQKVVLTLAEEFHNNGDQVHLITIKNQGIYYDIPEGVTHQCMNFKKGLGLYRMLSDFRLKLKLLKAIKDINQYTKIQAIFSHSYFSDTILRGEKFDFPILSTIHINYSECFLKGRKGLRRKLKCRKFQKTHNGKHLITVSQGLKDDLIKEIGIKPASIRVIYNPFNVNEIMQMADGALDIPYQDYILHVGRFAYQKRHDVLLKAFAQSNIACKLVLLGSGSESERLKITKMAEELNILDQIVMPGFSKNPYVWMKNAKLFVLSSDYEGFGLVLVESLISGTPVISTDCPSGPSEILENQPELLSPVGDSKILAKNISTFYAHPPTINEDSIQRFYVTTIVHQLKSTIKSLSETEK